MNKLLGLVVLPLFPLVVVCDMAVICPRLGLRVGAMNSLAMCWSTWKHVFWTAPS